MGSTIVYLVSVNTILVGGLVIDYDARLIYVDGERAEFSPKVYDLLVYMVKNKGLALTREQLINQVWGYDYYGDDRAKHLRLFGHLF